MSRLVIKLKPCIAIISPLIGAILGLLLINKINIFDYLLFVPEEQKFDVGITVYFAIIEALINWLLYWGIDKITNLKSTLEVIISLPNTTPDLQSHPQIYFREKEIVYFNVTVKLSGKRKHFCNAKVEIPDIRFATLQPSIKYGGVSLENNKIIIDLFYLTGTNKIVQVEHEYKFAVQKDEPNGKHSQTLYPIISGKKLTWKHNRIRIVMEE